MMTIRRTDERGSMPMALLIITVVVALSAILTPVVLRQITSTRNLEDRNSALNAAQAGMDLMMAKVRAASEWSGDTNNGLLENLPGCTFAGDAAAPGTAEPLHYAVTLEYRDQEGKKFDDCPPYSVPTTAVVTSTGTSNKVRRTLTATYVFTTSNTNIPGGQIRIDTTTLGSNQCIDAGPAKSPAVGSPVVMQTCNGTSSQQFGYTADLYLKLIYSESSTATYGMCLDAGSPHKTGNPIVFGRCPQTRDPRYQWSLDGSSRFNTTNLSTGKTDTSLCMNVSTPKTAGGGVALGTCGVNNSTNIWRSGAGVGAGMAGDNTAQLVNYKQFSRCLDVTDQSVGSSYMIAWFCKQSPDGIVDWNQRWVHPVPTPPAVFKQGNILITSKDGKNIYCLKSPRNTASNAYTTVTACDNDIQRAPDNVQWIVYHDTGDYGTSYRIKDMSGYCLTPTDLGATPLDVHKDGTSKVKVSVCNSSELQKWNAPPNINKPTPLTDLVEQ